MKIDPVRVLRILEGMVMENDALITPPKEYGENDSLINDIYLVAHASNCTCGNPHEDWLERTLEIEKILVDGKIINPWSDGDND